eukprot:506753_1
MTILILFLCSIYTLTNSHYNKHQKSKFDYSFLHQSVATKSVPFEITVQIDTTHTSTNPIIYITDLGGDPKGIKDSTQAFIDAINLALTYGAPNATLDSNVKDLGGVTIDLGGGDYKISKQLLIPSNYGNLRITDGTIRASSNFLPVDTFLIRIGDNTNAGQCNGNECNQNVAIENIALDCKHICAGGIFLYYAQMITIGPNIFITAFIEAGIRVFASGGVMIHNAYLAEYWMGDPNRKTATSTGIEMFTHDSYITNVVVFNAAIGIHVNGSANVLNGIHIWGLTSNTQITNLTGQIGILADGYCHDVRILNCYFDWNHLVIVGSVFALSVENSFFLAGGGVVFKAESPHEQIRGFNFVDSIYTIGKYKYNASTILVDESNGNMFSLISNVVISGFQMNGNYGVKNKYFLKTTATERVLTQMNSTKWIFDFNDVLVFKHVGIAKIDYSLKIGKNSLNRFVQHYAMIDEETDNKTVIIYTDKPCDATVFLSVDQSTYHKNFLTM